MSFRKNLVREPPHVFPHFGFLNRIKSLDSGWLIMAGLATRSSAGPSSFTSTEVIFIRFIDVPNPRRSDSWDPSAKDWAVKCVLIHKNSSYPSRHTVAFKHVNMVPLCASHRPADSSFDTTVARFPFLGRQARGKKHSIGIRQWSRANTKVLHADWCTWNTVNELAPSIAFWARLFRNRPTVWNGMECDAVQRDVIHEHKLNTVSYPKSI